MFLFPEPSDFLGDTTKNSLMTLETGLRLYRDRHGRYPDTSEGLAVLVAERILDKRPKDAWGNDFVYLNEGGKYKIVSYGADGAPGGRGRDADISSEDLKAKQ